MTSSIINLSNQRSFRLQRQGRVARTCPEVPDRPKSEDPNPKGRKEDKNDWTQEILG